MLRIRRRISTLTFLAALSLTCLLTHSTRLHAQARGLSETDAVMANPGAVHTIKRGSLIYPEELIGKKLQGYVTVNVLVGPGGKVLHVEFRSGAQELTDAAMEAARQTLYAPYSPYGRPAFFKTILTLPVIPPPSKPR